MFRTLSDSRSSFVISGNTGIGKTFSLIFWCKLAKTIADYKVKYGATELGQEIIEKYKLNAPMTFYYSILDDESGKRKLELILEQAPDGLKSTLGRQSNVAEVVEKISSFYSYKDIEVMFACDQVNKYYSWIQDKKHISAS